MRKMPLLRGIAILAVVCNHATGWGFTAMFWWTHRYRLVDSLPNYDQLGSLSYYALLAIQQFALFSVPAFLFISGFFITYAARGDSAGPSWKFVRTRIMGLLWPYLIWSLAIFIGDGIQGQWYSVGEYIRRLAVGGATGAYFFVPLICQFYLLSPLLARLGKKEPGILMVVSLLVQFLVTGLLYLPLLGIDVPDGFYNGGWTFFWHAIYFPLGVVCGFHYRRIKPWITRIRWGLLAATVVLGTLSIIESELLRLFIPHIEWARGGLRFLASFYAVAFILVFLSFDRISIPFTRAINGIGSQSYGIYLLHPVVLELSARVLYHVAPWMLAYQILFQPAIIVPAVGIPLVFMMAVKNSPVKRVYSYLFG